MNNANEKKINIVIVILIIVLTFAAYIPAMQGGFIWDDDMYVENNPRVNTDEGLWRSWTTSENPQYYPLVFTTLWIEHQLWGLNPAGYHIVNVTLHVINALLVWLILHRLGVRWAWLAGAIFALHPVHVESVAWITERKNVLSGMFYLLSLLTFLRFREYRKTGLYLVSLLLFIAALLSKTVTVSLPAAILIIYWWQGWRIRKRELLLLSPFFIIGMGMGLFTAWYEMQHVGAQGAEWDFSFWQRLVLAGRALWFYAEKLAAPFELSFIYPMWTLDAGKLTQWIGLAGFAITGLVLWGLRNKLGRGPLAGLAFFSMTLFPALGFFNVYPMRYSFVADHFQYMASLGLIAVFTGGSGWVVDKFWTTGIRTTGIIIAPGVVLLLLLGLLTWRQGHIYKDIETLWRDTLVKNPAGWLPNNNLGVLLYEQGKNEEALVHFREALKEKPAEPDTHYNMGNLMLRLGKMDEAVGYFERTLEGRPFDVKARNNLGNILARQGRFDDALKHYREALVYKQDSLLTHFNIGMTYMNSGRLEESIPFFEEALRIGPGYTDASLNLSSVLIRLNRFEEAVNILRKGLSVNPEDPGMTNKLAWLLATSPSEELRNGAEALELAIRVCEATNYRNPESLDTLAAAYAETGRFDKAVEISRKAHKGATVLGQAELARGIEMRLRKYEARQAFHVPLRLK